MDFLVTHPVPLAVHDVVTDLHVLQDLRHGETGGADDPRGRQDGEQQDAAASEFQPALHFDDAADVRGVARTPVGDDFVALMNETGAFSSVHYQPLSFGIAYLYRGVKR